MTSSLLRIKAERGRGCGMRGKTRALGRRRIEDGCDIFAFEQDPAQILARVLLGVHLTRLIKYQIHVLIEALNTHHATRTHAHKCTG